MTTFHCDRTGGSRPRGRAGPRRALAALAVALATPAAAQELTLPSGLAAALYDVVLEEAGQVMAPDAFSNPEVLEGSDPSDELPLDVDPATVERPADEPEPVEEEPFPDEAAADAGVADEPGATTGGLARFRLRVEGLGGEGAAYDDVAGDFPWLCEQVALPALAANGWTPTEVVISLSDREVEFGVPDPDAVQFFEGFRIEDGTCVPQAF